MSELKSDGLQETPAVQMAHASAELEKAILRLKDAEPVDLEAYAAAIQAEKQKYSDFIAAYEKMKNFRAKVFGEAGS